MSLGYLILGSLGSLGTLDRFPQEKLSKLSKFTSCSCISSLNEEKVEKGSSCWEITWNNRNFPKVSCKVGEISVSECSWRIQTITLVNYWKSLFLETDEMAGPLNPEWHSEIQFEILVSVPFVQSSGLSNTSDTMKWYVGCIYCIYVFIVLA